MSPFERRPASALKLVAALSAAAGLFAGRRVLSAADPLEVFAAILVGGVAFALLFLSLAELARRNGTPPRE